MASHQTSSSLRPASARRMLLFMRRAANSSVAAASALVAVSIASQRCRRARDARRSSAISASICGAFVVVEQFGVGGERRLRGFDQALRVDLRLAQRAGAHVDFGGREALFEHARDVVVGETVGRLHHHRRLHARALFAREHGQQAVRIDLIRHANARRAGRHRRNAAQLEARERAAIGDELALALHDVDRHRRLAVLEGREVLRARDRNRRIARDDLLGQTAHRLDAERQRNHVEQQPVVAVAATVAGEQIGLDRRAERDDLIRVEIDERRLAEERLRPRGGSPACASRRRPAPRP